MKKFLNIFFALTIASTIFVACDDKDNEINGDPGLGWVQFLDDDIINTSQSAQEVLKLPINIQVPNTESDLTINFDLVSIEGPNPSQYFTQTSITVPAGFTSFMGPDMETGFDYINLGEIVFDIANITEDLTEPMVFDVVLTGTSSSKITAGFTGGDKPVSKTISICPSVYDADLGVYLGDYTLTATESLFGVPSFNEQTVTLTIGDNGNFSRTFLTTGFIPGLAGEGPLPISFEFVDGVIEIDPVSTGVGCSSSIYLAQNTSTQSSTCDDSEIVLQMLEFAGATGGCGASDSPITLTLTKL